MRETYTVKALLFEVVLVTIVCKEKRSRYEVKRLASSSSRERSSSSNHRESSRGWKNEKKRTTNSCVFTSLASACALIISLFFRDVSTLFLHFFNHKVCQSLSLHTMQSIPSTVVVEVRKFSLSFSLSLSFKLSFTSFVKSVLFCLSLPSSLSRFLLPLESRSPWWWFLWFHFWISFWIDYPGNVLCCCCSL